MCGSQRGDDIRGDVALLQRIAQGLLGGCVAQHADLAAGHGLQALRPVDADQERGAVDEGREREIDHLAP